MGDVVDWGSRKGKGGDGRAKESSPGPEPPQRKSVFDKPLPNHSSRPASLRPSAATRPTPLKTYLVPACDAQGHSDSISTKVTPLTHRIISTLITSRKFPFETPADLVRWAIREGITHLEAQLKDSHLQSEMVILNAWVDAAKAQEERARFGAVLDQVKRTLHNLIDQGAATAAREVIDQIDAQVEGISDPYWRRRFHKELVEKFGPYVRWTKLRLEWEAQRTEAKAQRRKPKTK